jgi:hypothetical protein
MLRQPELEYGYDCRPVHHTQAWRALISWAKARIETHKTYFPMMLSETDGQ